MKELILFNITAIPNEDKIPDSVKEILTRLGELETLAAPRKRKVRVRLSELAAAAESTKEEGRRKKRTRKKRRKKKKSRRKRRK